MHPDPCIAIARTYQQETLRHAEAARKAAGLQRQSRVLTLPQIKFARRAGAIRVRLAQS